jgi:hypothetical protein
MVFEVDLDHQGDVGDAQTSQAVGPRVRSEAEFLTTEQRESAAFP